MHDKTTMMSHPPRESGVPFKEGRKRPLAGNLQTSAIFARATGPWAGPPRSLLGRLLACLRMTRASRQTDHGLDLGGRRSRQQRLEGIAVRLESILDELDAIGAQRVAIDVCMALERVKAMVAQDAGSLEADGVEQA